MKLESDHLLGVVNDLNEESKIVQKELIREKLSDLNQKAKGIIRNTKKIDFQFPKEEEVKIPEKVTKAPSIEKQKRIYLKRIFPEIENEAISRSIEKTVKLWNQNMGVHNPYDPIYNKLDIKIIQLRPQNINTETMNKLEGMKN